MNDKNKDLLKLLKSWGICDKYVHSVSITVNAGKLPVVQVEYKLPPVEEPKVEQEEYKPKFKVGDVLTSIHIPNCTFYVEAVHEVVPIRSSQDVSYKVRVQHNDSTISDSRRIVAEEGLLLVSNGKAKKYPLMLIQDISDWPHPPRYSVVAIVGEADGHQIGQVVYSAKTEQKAISAKLDFEEGRRTLFNIAHMRDD